MAFSSHDSGNLIKGHSLRKAGRRQAGFTLVEILVVITIMTLALGITLPVIWKSLSKTKFKAYVRETASSFRFARSEAVSSKSRVSVSIDLGGDTLKIAVQKPKSAKEKPDDEKQSAKKTPNSALHAKGNKDAEDSTETEQTDQEKSNKPYFIAGFRKRAEEDFTEEGRAQVHFYPLGNSDGGEFIIRGENEKLYYIIAIDSITGRVTVHEERSVP
jgi:prepilin-type N-terminal cleavage/methylation domain-containing protein